VLEAPSAPKLNTTAVLALISGVLGFCFWGIGGIVPIVLGISARAEISRSSERGGGLAIAGIALGLVNVATLVIAMGIAIAFVARSAPIAPPTTVSPPIAVAPPTAAPKRPSARPAPSAREVTRERGVRETLLGKVRLVDVDPDSQTLREALAAQVKAAREHQEQALLFVVSPNCLPCNGVALGLSDPHLQMALGGVRLLRVDASDFGPELVTLGIPVNTVPGFALLSDRLTVRDYVHGGEWDADIPENIAPVLGSFVRGKYTARRHPFHEPERPDQTTL
jgi:hypothetical protein